VPENAFYRSFRYGSGTTYGFVAVPPPAVSEDILKAEVVTVGTTRTLLATKGTTTVPNAVLIAVPTGGSTVYVGGKDITPDDSATGGFPIQGTQSLGWDLFEEDDMYGIVASGTQIVRVLRRNPE
jgi:hypothetical protein